MTTPPPDFITAPEKAAIQRFVTWAKTCTNEECVCRQGCTDHDLCRAGQLTIAILDHLGETAEHHR